MLTKGKTVGRYANRIKGGKFTLNGEEFFLTKNEGENTLHGGKENFKEKVWIVKEKGMDFCEFTYLSSDLEEGFPGNLEVSVRFTLKDSALQIDYEAFSDQDTVINLTNHAYFNLNGGGSVYDHKLSVDSDYILETDDELIPTGKFIETALTKYDLREMKKVESNYDDCFILNGKGLRKVAALYGLLSGIMMEMETTEPGVQVYNTDSEICLEAQHYPDSPNNPDFPTVILREGDMFESRTVYRFYENK
ncbi:MAG: galactose mutarotase [Clostridia bacterium]|nr:galactose mutarotase [Clostridia bacterium]